MTPTQAFDLRFDDACPDPHRAHLREVTAAWAWRTDPTVPRTPYAVTVRFVPETE